MPFSQDVKYLMSPECVCEYLAQNTPHIFLYSMFKLLLFEGEQKRSFCVLLNANVLLLPRQRAELQELLCVYSQRMSNRERIGTLWLLPVSGLAAVTLCLCRGTHRRVQNEWVFKYQLI